MKRWFQFISLAVLSIAVMALTGCEREIMTVVSADNPQKVGSAISCIYFMTCVVIFFFSEHGTFGSLLHGARYTGIILLILLPFQFASGNIGLSLPTAVAAVFGIAIPYIIALTKPRVKTEVVLQDDAEERLRRIEEQQQQTEAEVERHKRQLDGKDQPYR
ncbi:MAG: hypothetical protein V1738_06930 [Patescibacteria group bacterium]